MRSKASKDAQQRRVLKLETMGAYLYILRCGDSSYYVGTTVNSLETRLAEHQAGSFDGYTALRRPVTLVFHQHFERLDDAAAAERQIKGWRRGTRTSSNSGSDARMTISISAKSSI